MVSGGFVAVADNVVGVGGAVVGVTVGSEFLGVAGSAVGVGGTVVDAGDGVDVGVDVQAATKTVTRMSTIFR